MAEKSVAYRLLSLFTSPDRAEAIEGDLLEERHTHGSVWFAINVVTTAFALWKQAVELELLRTTALSVLAVAVSCLVCGALELLRAELGPLGVSSGATTLLIPVFAFLLGAALVRGAPRIGAVAATATSLFLLLLFLYTQIDLRGQELRGSGEDANTAALVGAAAALVRDLGAAALIYLLPLNCGSVFMHGRRARR